MHRREQQALWVLVLAGLLFCGFIALKKYTAKPTPLPDETARQFNQLLEHGE